MRLGTSIWAAILEAAKFRLIATAGYHSSIGGREYRLPASQWGKPIGRVVREDFLR